MKVTSFYPQPCKALTFFILLLTWVGTGPAFANSAPAPIQPFLFGAGAGSTGQPTSPPTQGGITPNNLLGAAQSAATGNLTGVVNNLGGNAVAGAVTGLATGNVAGAVNSLVGGAGAGNIAGAVAGAVGLDPSVTKVISQGLSILQGPQSLTNPTQVANLFKNPAISNLMGGLNPLQAGQAVDSLFRAAINPQSAMQMATSTGMNMLTNAIGTQVPQLAQALGGLASGGLPGLVSQSVAAVASQALGQTAGQLLGGVAGGVMGSAVQAALGLGGQGKSYSVNTNPADIGGCNTGCGACGFCRAAIPAHYAQVRAEITSEFQKHRSWIVNNFWQENILPALMLMAEQLSVAGIQQVNMFGAMMDAKHQLETQRLFQEMTAQAHKDYHPSEGMCTFGTNVRSLANSERKSDLAQITFAGRMSQRQLMSGDTLSVESGISDTRSRLDKFRTIYCDKNDNSRALDKLCPSPSGKPERRNIDIDYTRNIESRLTIETDFTQSGGSMTEDEEDLFALSANLFAHNIAPRIPPEKMGVPDGRIRQAAAERYMDLRAVFAKRSVAQNSFAAIVAERAEGSPESAPYTKALMRELGIQDTNEIEKILGKNPSYFAQMEVLTKKIYQNPTFYTELYDKPANVSRKGAALQAIGLMQDRDLFDSLLRTEAVLSVLLETMLQKEQAKLVNQLPAQTPVGGAR